MISFYIGKEKTDRKEKSDLDISIAPVSMIDEEIDMIWRDHIEIKYSGGSNSNTQKLAVDDEISFPRRFITEEIMIKRSICGVSSRLKIDHVTSPSRAGRGKMA